MARLSARYNVARLSARYNTDLADDLGNLLNRTNAMLHRYRGGIVPSSDPSVAAQIPAVGELAALANALPKRVTAALDGPDARAALDTIWELVARCNRAVDETAPRALDRAERAGDAGEGARLDAVLYALLEGVRLTVVHLEPFLPGASARLLAALGLPDDTARPYAERVRWGGLPPGTRIAPPLPLFPKLAITDTPAAER